MEQQIKIGITGHRNIRKEDRETLANELRIQLKKICGDHPDCEPVIYCSLASGADRLAADVAMKDGIRIIAVLPFTSSAYEKNFTRADRKQYRKQLKYASGILNMAGEKNELRETGYRKAGLYIAENCDCVIAFWDGILGTVTGCETGDIVKYVKDRFPEKCIWIKTHREKRYMTIQEADRISDKNRQWYMYYMLSLAIVGVILVTLFLFYDELDLGWMIVAFAVIFFLGIGMLNFFERKKFQEKYIQHRLLAELLRVQMVMNAAGIEKNAADYLPWTMKKIGEWLKERIDPENVCYSRTDNAAEIPESDSDRTAERTAAGTVEVIPAVSADGSNTGEKLSLSNLREKWLQTQYQYHLTQNSRVLEKIKKNSIIHKIAITLTSVVIIAAVFFEFISIDVSFKLGNISIKGWILILYGIFSAVSLFLSEYYGKLALERRHEDHVSMAELYKYALDTTENTPLTPKFVEEIAREEVLENGNWYSFMKENKPSVSLLH